MPGRVAAWPLSRKILGLAALNLVLLGAVLLVFANQQFGLRIESLLLGPARDRILAIANACGRELETTEPAQRAALLATYSRQYEAEFMLTDPRGRSMTGEPLTLPPELLDRMRQGGPRPDGKGQRPDGKGPRPDGQAPQRSRENGLNDRPGDGPPDRRETLEDRPPSDLGAGGERRGDRPRPPLRRPPTEVVLMAITPSPLTYWVGVRMPIPDPEARRLDPGVLLLRSGSIFNPKLFFDWRLLLMAIAALTGVTLACWWPFVSGVTRSIRQMDLATERIAQGRFDADAAPDRDDELGHLGQQINLTAARLESFVKNQKRFLGDIAHELCAPIARIQFAVGILEQRVEETQLRHVEVLRDEVQEMSTLVNELLLFSKAGLQSGPVSLVPVLLEPVAKRALARQVPGTSPVLIDIDPALAALGDETQLLRAVSNLLRNALRYAGDAGPITVAAMVQKNRVVVTVSDCGPGLPESELAEVFAPFYRPEMPRSRDTGGTGLGLAIVKASVEACGGTVFCRNRQPSGLEVVIELKAA
ncbi:MAG: HAMP domain-containing sensor histidine kinase [Acidobacteria bacterium]|nr:HAMP domain-containing sensor histidine kinase [Acidobacteriota bacterium]